MPSIYFLIDPRDESIRYVGQTAKEPRVRVNEHVDVSRGGLDFHVNRWIRELLRMGFRPNFVAFNVENANSAESLWISVLKLAGCPLTNMTAGGESFRRGIPHRLETIEKMKRAHAGRRWTAEQIEKRAALRRKPFRCVETGEIFGSIQDFISRGYGSSEIKNVLNGHRETFKGLHYERLS
jgi:hypothetical protein